MPFGRKEIIRFIVLFLVVAFVAAFFLRNRADRDSKGVVKNLVIVVFDAMRADRMSLYGFSKKTTPFLDANRQSFLLFKDVKADAPWTIPSHASLFTGKLPAEHRAEWGHAFLEEGHETLAETLSAKGYSTMALVANKFLQTKRIGLLQGFQYVYAPERKREERIIRKLDSELAKAKAEGRPLFIFMNFMNNHLPYNPGRYGKDFGVEGAPFINGHTTQWEVSAGLLAFSEDEKDRHRRLYDASVRYSDNLAERLMGVLKKHGILEESLIVITSDHGEGLGYHQEMGHTISVWEEQLAVPLLMRFPDASYGGRIVENRVTLKDLHPMILGVLKEGRVEALDPELERATNSRRHHIASLRSYFSESERSFNRRLIKRYPSLAKQVSHMHVLYCGDFKLIVHANGNTAFFNIASDPLETDDIKVSNGNEFKQCLEQYQKLVTEKHYTPFDYVYAPGEEEAVLDKGDVDALKTLGYL